MKSLMKKPTEQLVKKSEKILVNSILKIEKVSAGYGDFHVLSNISMHLNEGEIVALIGPNGAGKSTILKAIFSIADVYSGKIFFENQDESKNKIRDITKSSTHELLELGISYVPQGRINFPSMNVLDNLLAGVHMIQDKKIIDQRLKFVFLQFPALKKKQNLLAYSLSGGEQQMLAISRALMQNPKVLLLDEPSLGLSPKLVKETFKHIKDLSSLGISILVVEQNAKKAIEIADRTYLLEDGKVVFSGGKEIIKDPKIKEVYLGGRY